MNSQNSSLFFRAIQGHTGVNLMAPELLLFHRNGKSSGFIEDARLMSL